MLADGFREAGIPSGAVEDAAKDAEVFIPESLEALYVSYSPRKQGSAVALVALTKSKRLVHGKFSYVLGDGPKWHLGTGSINVLPLEKLVRVETEWDKVLQIGEEGRSSYGETLTLIGDWGSGESPRLPIDDEDNGDLHERSKRIRAFAESLHAAWARE